MILRIKILPIILLRTSPTATGRRSSGWVGISSDEFALFLYKATSLPEHKKGATSLGRSPRIATVAKAAIAVNNFSLDTWSETRNTQYCRRSDERPLSPVDDRASKDLIAASTSQ